MRRDEGETRTADRVRELFAIARELGAIVPIYLLLQVVFGIAPAALILVTAAAVAPTPPAVPVLVGWLGGILAVGTIADAVSPGLRSQIDDRTHMVLRRRWMTRVASWGSLRVFEDPDLVRSRSEAERAVGALVTVPVLLGFVAASVAGIAPVAGVAVEVSPWIVLAAIAGGLPLAIGLALLYQRAWDARTLRLPLVLRSEGLNEAATSARMAKDFRAFELEGWALRRWRAAQAELLSEVGSVRRRATIRVLMWSLAGTALLIATLFATLPPQASPGDLVILIGLLLQVTTSLAVLVQAAADLSQLRRPLRAYLDFVLRDDHEPMASRRHSWLGAEALTFTYSGARTPALAGISCRFAVGRLNVVVGPNGAGKSTLLRVLDGLSLPDGGEVSLGVRADRAVLHQDFARFPFSVRESVAAGSTHADEDVWAVLETVGLAAAIGSLPDGLDTPLYRDTTDAATELSGGQWQRVAVARLLLRARTADIVVLDEPTAALDALGEAELLERLLEELRGKTVILVTHRLQWALRAARILEVTSPTDVRTGTHEQLMRDGGWYAEAFEKQASAYRRR